MGGSINQIPKVPRPKRLIWRKLYGISIILKMMHPTINQLTKRIGGGARLIPGGFNINPRTYPLRRTKIISKETWKRPKIMPERIGRATKYLPVRLSPLGLPSRAFLMSL